MGDTELSYYLPSRADGVNDMSMCVSFRAPRHLFAKRRVLATWALLLLRHPLLAASVIAPPANPFETDYSDARFSYAAPSSPADIMRKAGALAKFQKDVPVDEVFNAFVNGKRILGADRLSYLILTENHSNTDDHAEYILFICSTHSTGDSVAFHLLANDFFTIIAGTKIGSRCTATDLEELVRKEWQARWGSGSTRVVLPPPVEDRLPLARSMLRKAVGKVDFLNRAREQIVGPSHSGGHALPRTMEGKRKVTVQTFTFDEFTSRTILQTCKSQGVSVSNALFALCALAWSRTQLERGSQLRTDLPIMMYTALNLRPYTLPFDSSYWMTALGFFNVILPSFLPSRSRVGEKTSWKTLRSTFWHRARSAKAQSTRASKHPLVASRAREMARQRSETAKAFAVEDDAKEPGLAMPPRTPMSPSSIIEPSTAPSTALLGLSHLGNLDDIYKHSDYPSIRLQTMAPAVRMRPGGLLLFGYTFAEKLTFNLEYDLNGFKDEVVEAWWRDVLRGFDELLIGKPTSRL
ncbi:hypothetical protein M407DRAFT_85718 [Tulasnella calospora MUT 4182]|uniref:Condensation domain-containing protein n=1 Tax=Tulasnella calospora MUT 4182 TaxID=1051891 RepID=A0A0C3Q1Y5_9AGAM|nr:hypothetical protein M407DRAFT_85718 [Tulasnella calospora MUT 4182]